MVEKLRNMAEHPQERGLLNKVSLSPKDIGFYTHFSLTNSPALQRPTPWTQEDYVPHTPSSCLLAQSSTSGEPKACLNPDGPSSNVGFRLAESTESYPHFLFVCFLFCFLGPHLWHMEVPRLGVISEL